MEINNKNSDVEFNEAFSIVARINILQSEINKKSANLLEFDEIVGDYNYNLVFRLLNSFLLELSQDLTDKEMIEARKIKDLIRSYMNIYPIFEMNNRGQRIINTKSWERIENGLFFYRTLLNKYKKIHGFSNPEKKDTKRTIIE